MSRQQWRATRTRRKWVPSHVTETPVQALLTSKVHAANLADRSMTVGPNNLRIATLCGDYHPGWVG